MTRRIGLAEICREPFRAFFPAGVLAGVLGVALWPLYLWGATSFYPGQTHPRLMTYGFFGAFIVGFLGTALPRMLTARPFGVGEVVPLLALHAALVVALLAGKVLAGDILFLVLLLSFLGCAISRAKQRKDLPPPGFVLVGLAMLSILAGTSISIVEGLREIDPFWVMLQRLLSYQGFVLLPILGISPFLLPRFFGMTSAHDFPESLTPTPAWWRKAALAFVTGLAIVASFVVEAKGWLRTGHAMRFLAVLAYVVKELPMGRAPKGLSAPGLSLRIAYAGILAGFLTAALFPGFRVSLMHLTLVGGFAVITFTVATRVVFGHSGNLAKLEGRNRWLLVAVGLMLLGMSTRMSGDFWPKLMASHYSYGAILWIVGVLVWSWYVLPKVRQVDEE